MDFIAFGETMIRLSPPGACRLEQASQLEVHVGGSESNTAVGIARLGHQAAWVSRLTRNPLGRSIAQCIASHGVDVSGILWTDADRVGTYYMERGVPPRPSEVYYDRKHSAFSRIATSDVQDSVLLNSATVESTCAFASTAKSSEREELHRDPEARRLRIFHTTGISLGVSQSAAETTLHAARLAKDAGMHVSFDLNFRSKLWDAATASSQCETTAAMADTIFLPHRDIHDLYGIRTDSVEHDCLALSERWPTATIVVTLGDQGAWAVPAGTGSPLFQPAHAVTPVERLGGGDAFSAGYLSSLLDGESASEALRRGNASAAIKYTIPGDLPLFDRERVLTLASRDCNNSTIDR